MTSEKIVLPYKDRDEGKKEQVATMFDNISPKYDLLNRVLSFGIDTYWRKRAIALLKPEKPRRILDIATGTADFAIEALRLNPDKVVGVDISAGMLAHGREKLARRQLDHKIELQLADSEKLPFADNSFDAVIVSFGVRNFENLERGLADMNRVLRPGGTCVVLEFSKPRRFPMKQLYDFYSYRILPTIGRLVSRDDSAYRYLPESVRAFPDGADFTAVMERAGFASTRAVPLTFGICSIYTGKK
jgi:demethylmenaquinone methyltransferase/2-methoxy-6-polyprenyl-1,4-benzoquinol methylase